MRHLLAATALLAMLGAVAPATGGAAAALLTRGRERISVAVLTSGSPRHRYAPETLRGVFRRLPAPLRSAG